MSTPQSAAIALIDTYLAEREAELIDFTRQLVAIDSQIPPYADEREIAAFLIDSLPRLGLPQPTVVGPSPERPSLVAVLAGRDPAAGKNLMLNGHIDTKPVGDAADQWRTDPFIATVIDGDMFGLGTNDMKAAVAAMAYAAAAVTAAQVELDGDVVLAFVADEEAGAQHGSKYLAERVEGIDACLIGEPSGWTKDWQGIHVVTRGVCGFRLTVTGTQQHSSLSDRVPNVNASVKLAGLMTRMADELTFTFQPHPLGQVGPTLNIGVMLAGGTYFGVIPGRAECACDLRTVPGMTLGSVRADIEAWLKICRRDDPELNVELSFEPSLEWVPWSELPTDHPLVVVTQSAAEEVLGSSPDLSVFPGATDAQWFAGVGIPTLPSFGPGMLTSAHGPNEFVSLTSVIEAARMYARIIVGFCA